MGKAKIHYSSREKYVRHGPGKGFFGPERPSKTRAFVGKSQTNVGQCCICDEWIPRKMDTYLRSHRVGPNQKESWPCPGSNSSERDPIVGKEMRELLAELKELDFTWEITSQNHVKAKAPTGEIIVFSVGGKPRSVENQRAMLNKWKRDNLKPATPEEPKEEPMADGLSELAVNAIEAMVYTIQSGSVSTAEMDDLKAEVELLREENARLTAENDEMTRMNEVLTTRIGHLEDIEAKFNKLKKALE